MLLGGIMSNVNTRNKVWVNQIQREKVGRVFRLTIPSYDQDCLVLKVRAGLQKMGVLSCSLSHLWIFPAPCGIVLQ